jgi:predicted nucleic acid-binding protein
VNAFNPHADGHADSLAVLASIQERADPVIVPSLLISEIASAVARASDDPSGAREYARATAGLPHLMLVSLASTMAGEAAELAATYRLRGADAVYLAAGRRYGTTIVTRDEEQRSRGSSIVTCQTPAEALSRREKPARAWRRLSPRIAKRPRN